MNQYETERTGRPLRDDFVLAACVLLIAGLGLVTLLSSSYAFSERKFNGNGFEIIVHQLKIFGAALILFAVCVTVPIKVFRMLTGWALVLAAVFCIMTFIPFFRVERNGAARWINLGPVEYQPSEAVKLALPLYLAHIFDKKQHRTDGNNVNYFFSIILSPVIVTAFFLVMILFQNDYSTTILVGFNAFAMFLAAGMRLRFLIPGLCLFSAAAALPVISNRTRLSRVAGWISQKIPGLSFPDMNVTDTMYQADNAARAINSGGFWGKGLGQGAWKIIKVPEVQTDFIFAAYAEESGFFGVLIFFALFALFAFWGYRAVWRSKSFFNQLVCFGLVTMIVSQALLNTGVAGGFLPTTGIPLPFFSAGGSSLLTTFAASGLIVNLSRQSIIAGSESSFARGVRDVQ
ncbi:MAG: putative lipid II flippase FtsW [Treponema sp.]|jgi:cell division protein FtsW|nr:putative lipid II flippase FtsW [Treponema sp.]